MRRPSAEQLPAPLLAAARSIAARLAASGQRAWLVGGAVRDLALGLVPAEIDLASAAAPDEVERVFEHTVAVGKAFGTIVVRAPPGAPAAGAPASPGAPIDVQVTTFRSDHGSSDQRRPDRVEYGRTLEEDARRRDFTCNALYLDPLTDEFRDPTGGLADLERRLLRTVGDPRARFTEDGLRLLRLARFSAGLGLTVEPETLAAARGSAAALAGVSPERVLAEFTAIFRRPGAPAAVAMLREAGLLALALPGQAEIRPWDMDEARAADLRAAALDALPSASGPELGLSVLYDPLVAPERDPEAAGEALLALDRLRPPRALRYAAQRLWRALDELAALARGERASGKLMRAARIRLRREREWRWFAPYARAWGASRDQDLAMLDDLERFWDELAGTDVHPELLVKSGDLQYVGVPRGPIFGQLLEEAEELQLEGTLCTREAAKSWLAARAAELLEDDPGQLGGKRRRKA